MAMLCSSAMLHQGATGGGGG
eukprot:COSAG02_NODE_12015_length_1613_cov_1.401585_2_plen_20_part_01